MSAACLNLDHRWPGFRSAPWYSRDGVVTYAAPPTFLLDYLTTARADRTDRGAWMPTWAQHREQAHSRTWTPRVAYKFNLSESRRLARSGRLYPVTAAGGGGVLPHDPSADRFHDVALLGVVERAPGGDVVAALQAGAAARRGGVLRDEHGMPAVGPSDGRCCAVRPGPASARLAPRRVCARLRCRAGRPPHGLGHVAGTLRGSGAARSGAAWHPTRPSPRAQVLERDAVLLGQSLGDQRAVAGLWVALDAEQRCGSAAR